MTESDVKTAVLHRKFAEHMDPETADALIERLPPDWEQLATKTDLARLEIRMSALESTVEARMGTVEARMGALETTVEARAAALESTVEARMGALETTVEARVGALEITMATGVESLEAKLGAMEGRINRRAASDLKAMMFAFAGFALAVVGVLVTVLVSGIPSAG